MKNLINYYYNLTVSEVKRIDDKFVLSIDGFEYLFLPFFGDFEYTYNIYKHIIAAGRYCHEIIFNKLSLPVTYYDNTSYILLKKNFTLNQDIIFDDVLNYDFVVFNEKNVNWKHLWKEKIDYYEYQISQMGVKHRRLSKSLSYYIGLCENSISLLNYVDFNKIKPYICHKRIEYKEKFDDFFNPLYMVVDNRTRDIAEFIKMYYINEQISIQEIVRKIDMLNLDYNEAILLLARLLYPTYFFDLYDKIFQDKLQDEKVDLIIKKAENYELLIKDVYKFLKIKYKIPEVEWLYINQY